MDINELLSSTQTEIEQTVKTEFLNLLKEAKVEQEEFVKETAEKIEKWLLIYAQGEFDKDELEALLNARKRVVQQNLNTIQISARARLEKMTMGLIDIVLNKLIGQIM